jgi:hypothetical protein
MRIHIKVHYMNNYKFHVISFGLLFEFTNVVLIGLCLMEDIFFLKHKYVTILTSVFIIHLYRSFTSY